MARLPDENSLSNSSDLGVQRSLIQSDTSSIGTAMSRFGGEVRDTGRIINSYADTQAKLDDKLNKQLAESEVTLAKNQVLTEQANDQDIEKNASQYQKRLNDAVIGASKRFRSAQDQEGFVVSYAPEIQKVQLKTEALVKQKQDTAFLNDANAKIDALRETASTSADPEVQKQAATQAVGIVGTLKEKGILNEADHNKLLKQYGEDFAKASLNKLTPSARIASYEGAITTAALDVMANGIIGAESGGNPNAKNPKSSATGLGQFTEGTWLAEVAKNKPAWAAGKSNAEILALRTNPEYSREITKAHVQSNMKALNDAQLPVTPGTVYLAHFAGIGGATRLLKADPNASVASVLDSSAIAANPTVLKNSDGTVKRVGQVIDWASGVMKGRMKDTPYADLAESEQLKIYQSAQGEQAKIQIAASKQEEAIYDSGVEALRMRAAQGQITPSELDSLEKGNFYRNLDDMTAVRKAYDDHRESIAAQQTVSSGVLDGQVLNAEIPEHAKILKKAYATETDPTVLERAAIKQNFLPDNLEGQIAGGLNSSNPKEVGQALQTIARLTAQRPNIVGFGKSNSPLYDAANSYNAGISVGRGHEATVADYMRMRDAKAQGKELVPEKLVETKIKEDFGTPDQVLDTLAKTAAPGTFIFSSRPEFQNDDRIKSIVTNDFTEALTRKWRETGNYEAAKTYATKQMGRLYGESNGVLIKYPPEKVLPLGPDGTHNYIQEQAKKVVDNSEAYDITLLPRVDTAAAWENGNQNVPYTIRFLVPSKLHEGLPETRYVAAPFVPNPMLNQKTAQQTAFDNAKSAISQPIFGSEGVDSFPMSEADQNASANEIARTAANRAQADVVRRQESRIDARKTIDLTMEATAKRGAIKPTVPEALAVQKQVSTERATVRDARARKDAETK